MLIIFVRCLIIYFALLIVMRLMGKRQLGELQPFEFAITLIIADVVSIPMQDTSIPILHGIIPILTIFIIHLIISKLNFKSIRFRKIIDGNPTIIINENGLNYKAMKSLNMHINDLMESLRGQGYFNLKDVHIAIVETNGTLSVLPKFNATEVTNLDLDIEGNEPCLPYSIILEGKIMKDTLTKYGKMDKNDIKTLLKKHRLKVKDVYLLSIDDNNEVFIQPYSKKSIVEVIE